MEAKAEEIPESASESVAEDDAAKKASSGFKLVWSALGSGGQSEGGLAWGRFYAPCSAGDWPGDGCVEGRGCRSSAAVFYDASEPKWRLLTFSGRL